MKSLYIHKAFYLAFLGSSTLYAQQAKQESVLVNTGTISVAEGGVLSTTYDFDNQSEALVKQDGTVYFYGNFNNDNLYYHSKGSKQSTAVFTRFEEQGMQLITGKQPSEFYNVVLSNGQKVKAFDLQNEMNVNGTVDFQDGIILVDSIKGMLSFQQGSKAINVKDASHAEGEVEKIGNEAFTYPKGDKGYYRYAKISAPQSMKDAFVGKYTLDDHQFFKSRPTTAGVINLLNKREYWLLDKGSNTSSEVMVTLSWDSRTTPAGLLADPEKELHIVRFDEKQQMWVDEGGVVDLSSKTISTPAVVNGYGFFTLATVKTDWLLDGDVVIYNLVSPDGDGKNDYFVIDNINKYPNNKVEVFNRWGVKVYETTDYDNAQNNNVFRGYSEGRVTVNKNEKLPTGTYFYIVSYEYKDAQGQGSRMIKKSGYLHLESN